MKEKNLELFYDNRGWLILGNVVNRSKDSIEIENPVQVSVNPTPQNQFQVQMFPLFFLEFINDESRAEPITWKFPVNLCTFPTNKIDMIDRLVNQYESVFSQVKNVPVIPEGAQPEPKVVKLLDD